MAEGERRQLGFDVGGAPPDFASLKIGGSMLSHRELKKGEEIHVRVLDPDGEVIAEGEGHITAVAFKDKRGKFGDVESTERAQTAKLEA